MLAHVKGREKISCTRRKNCLLAVVVAVVILMENFSRWNAANYFSRVNWQGQREEEKDVAGPASCQETFISAVLTLLIGLPCDTTLMVTSRNSKISHLTSSLKYSNSHHKIPWWLVTDRLKNICLRKLQSQVYKNKKYDDDEEKRV